MLMCGFPQPATNLADRRADATYLFVKLGEVLLGSEPDAAPQLVLQLDGRRIGQIDGRLWIDGPALGQDHDADLAIGVIGIAPAIAPEQRRTHA